MELVGPAVVRLDITHAPTAGHVPLRSGPADRMGSLLREDCGVGSSWSRAGGGRPGPRVPETEQGSGFVMLLPGAGPHEALVVTSEHVVRGAAKIDVTFPDGRTFDGRVRGSDQATDLAVVAIRVPEGMSVPAAPVGDSAKLAVGDWLVAVGHPFGLDHTVTVGVVSHLRRTAADIGAPDRHMHFLQTDCALNPGNSGGPLCDAAGRVVAVAMLVHAEADGIAFAAPLRAAGPVLEALAAGRKVT